MAQDLKTISRDFLLLCAKGDSRTAFEKYVAKNFKHHNAWFKGDAHTLMLAMEESAKQNPGTDLQIKHVLQDNNMVAVHSHIKHKAQDPGMAVMHIMRFENDKIAELWDFGQPVPKDMVNENGMF